MSYTDAKSYDADQSAAAAAKMELTAVQVC